MISYLDLRNGGRLAYHQTEGTLPGIVFLGGFRSDMSGVKALALEHYCKKQGRAFIRFDYEGHGESSGKFEEGTISRWLGNALEVLTRLTHGKQILVGSSMGGWIALLVARKKPAKVAAILGIAAAPDFTEDRILNQLSPLQMKVMNKIGKIMLDSGDGDHYPVTRELLEDGRHHLLLNQTIAVNCPVRLLHGMKDMDIPWETSMALNQKLESRDVRTILLNDGDHRLSEPRDIARMLDTLGKLLELFTVR